MSSSIISPVGMSDQQNDWPGDVEELAACPVCDATDFGTIHENLKDYFFGSPGTWTLQRCEVCRSGFLNPRPTEKTIGIAYRNYYTHEQAGGLQSSGLTALIAAWVGAGYVRRRYGGRRQVRVPAPSWIIHLFPRKKASIDLRFRHLPRRKGLGRGRVLDIGCGNGTFLLHARDLGWDACGSDPDPAAVKAARAAGLDVREGGAEAWKDCPFTFDAVTLNHVIEHVHDPARLVRQTVRLLKPGGMLFIETPNIDAVGHQIHGRYWRGLEAPRHLCLFTRDSLVWLLKTAGFEDIRFPTRPSPAASLSRQSVEARLSAGETGDAQTDTASAFDTRGHRSEFLTLICTSPRQ